MRISFHQNHNNISYVGKMALYFDGVKSKTISKYFISRIPVIIRYLSSGQYLNSNSETNLKSIMIRKVPEERERINKFRKKYGSTIVGDISVNMLYSGMYGMIGLVRETSTVDTNAGLLFRGYSIEECRRLLPKTNNSSEPLPEGMFWLLMTGDIPNESQVKAVSKDWLSRASLPSHIVTMLNSLPRHLQPITQLSSVISALNSESSFARSYASGLPKSKYWEYFYEDVMDLIAKIPIVAAIIYRNMYHDGKSVQLDDTNQDWSSNFAHHLGHPEISNLLRLYMTLNSDNGGIDVTSHTVHVVGSALSSPYLSLAAGFNGLAGPIHSEMNEHEQLLFLTKLRATIGDDPTDEELIRYITQSVATDFVDSDDYYNINSRFALLRDISGVHDDPLLLLAIRVHDLTERMNARSLVDESVLFSRLLQHGGIRETGFHRVLFGMSRALGVLASLIWARALSWPIEHPISMSTNCLIDATKKSSVSTS